MSPPLVRLEERVDGITVGWVGSMVSEYVSEGIPFLRSTNIRAHKLDLSDLRYISSEFHAKISKSRLQGGDVAVVRTGKPGTAVCIPQGAPEMNCSDLVIIHPGPRVNGYWLSYYINAAADGFVASRLVGAVQQHFNIGSARQIMIPDLSRPEQDAIAALLGALDDKIAANAALVRTVDQLATTLTKSHIQPTSATSLGDLAIITMGSSPPGSSYNEQGVGLPFYQGIRDFDTRTPGKRIWTDQPVRFAEEGDILLSVRAPVGRVNVASSSCCIGRGLAAIKSSVERPATLFYLVQLADWTPFEAEGTIFGSINQRQLNAVLVPVLSEPERLEVEVAGLERVISSHLEENRVLTELRDTLLPALMSGRLRLKDAERQVEDAV